MIDAQTTVDAQPLVVSEPAVVSLTDAAAASWPS